MFVLNFPTEKVLHRLDCSIVLF